MRTLLCLCFLVFGTVCAWAHDGHEHGKVGDLGASAAFAPSGRLFVVSKESATNGAYAVVRSSTDFGQKWSDPVRINSEPEAVAADGDSRPKIAVGPTGEVYVTWTQPLAKPYTGNIRFSRSLDGGKTFSAPLIPHTDRRQITHRFDSIAVDAKGTVYLAWIDKRDLEDQKLIGRSYRGAAVYTTLSQDQGATFKSDAKLADNSCECCRIALLPNAEGGVYAFWRHVFEPNIRDHALAGIDENGQRLFLRQATFDEWKLDACPHQGPGLAHDANGTLHAVWFTQGKQPGALYGRLLNGRVEGQKKIGSDSAVYADIVASGQRVMVAWKDFDGKATRLWAMLSADAGKTWREIQIASATSASDQPRALQYGGHFYVFWNTAEKPFGVFELP